MKDLQNEYNQWHKDVATKESLEKTQLCTWHNEAFKTYNNVKGKSVLEIGCGRGDFSLFLGERGGKVHGTDFSNAAIEIAKEKAIIRNARVDFSVVDAQTIPFENESFDVIFSCECLEHIPDPQKALNEIYRILKSGGTAVITTENYSNAMIIPWIQSWVTKKAFNSGDEVQPIENFFLYWNVKKMMKKSGFRVKKITGWHYVFLILPRSLNVIVEKIENKFLRSAVKPFARHMTFLLQKF